MIAPTSYPSTTELTTTAAEDRRPDLLRDALAYARRGVPVFPCKPGRKEPLTAHGHLDATTDPEQIKAWWTRWPAANIAYPTGERSGLLVIDVDPHHGGDEGLDALEAKHDPLPRTRLVRTGSGGRHIYLKYPTGSNIRNSAGTLGPGLDVRGEGGYVVAPPSRTTSPYKVLDRAPLANAPEWLPETLRRPSRVAGKPLTPPHPRPPVLEEEAIPEGGRNAGLTRIAGRLRAHGFDGPELLAELERINLEQCSPPLPAGEVLKIARSAERWPVGNAKPGPGPEVLDALESAEASLWDREWRGMGGKSERDILVALVKIARQHGTKIPAGVRVTVDYRSLALAAATGLGTAHRAIQRLRRKDLVRYDNESREDDDAGALVVVARRVERSNHSLRSGGGEAGGKSVPPCAPPAHRTPYRTLTATRLRWSSREIRRLGKSCGQAVDTLERAGGVLALAELAEHMGVKRSRDLKRRVIDRLEAAGVVWVAEDTVSLAADWLDALNIERERAGEIERYRLDVRKYDEDRLRYTVKLLSWRGLSEDRIAEHVGISPERVRQILKRPEPVPEPEEKEEAPPQARAKPPVETGSKKTLDKEDVNSHNTEVAINSHTMIEAERAGAEPDMEHLEDLGLDPEDLEGRGEGDRRGASVELEDKRGDLEPAGTVSPLAAAVREYLERNPGDRRQPPGWIGNTLWCEDLYPGKPTPAEIRAALDDLAGERVAA